MGCNASKNKFERGPQETDDQAKPNNKRKLKNREVIVHKKNKESNENEKNKDSNKNMNSFFRKFADEKVTCEREESEIEETDVAGGKQTVSWFMNNGLALGSSKSTPSEDNSRPGNEMKRQPDDRNEFELYGIVGAQAVLVEDTVASESRVPARDGPA